MSQTDNNAAESVVVMTSQAITSAVGAIAREIIEHHADMDKVVLLGILSRGRPLADRIAEEIAAQSTTRPRVGSLATTLYRDDLRSGMGTAKIGARETHFDFDVGDATVVLVDDVIGTGRTARAALDEVMDYGRPARIRLACLIDRGLRELPIQPDFLGKTIETESDDHVSVRLNETDGEDIVLLRRAGTS